MKVATSLKRTLARTMSRQSLESLRRGWSLVRSKDIPALELRCFTADLLARQYQPSGFTRMDLIVMYLALGEANGDSHVGMSLLRKLLQRDTAGRRSDRAFHLFLEEDHQSKGIFIPPPTRIDRQMNLTGNLAGLALALYRGEPQVTVAISTKRSDARYGIDWLRSHGFTAAEIATLEQAQHELFQKMGLQSRPWRELSRLHEQMRQALLSQPQAYGRGDFYQSCEELLLHGQRPTALRFRAYALDRELQRSDRVLDIGCNCGFFALATARHVAAVDAFDINPSLITIGRLAQQYLGIPNCNFTACSFDEFRANEGYDVIFSFAVHHWVGLPIQAYAAKLRQMLRPGGRVLFESHDLMKHDRDWDAKLAALSEAGFEPVQERALCDDGLLARKYVLLRMC